MGSVQKLNEYFPLTLITVMKVVRIKIHLCKHNINLGAIATGIAGVFLDTEH